MERNRKRPPQKTEPQKLGYGGRLWFRIFGSVLLILAAIFIKQNAPDAVRAAQYALGVWTVSLP